MMSHKILGDFAHKCPKTFGDFAQKQRQSSHFLKIAAEKRLTNAFIRTDTPSRATKIHCTVPLNAD